MLEVLSLLRETPNLQMEKKEPARTSTAGPMRRGRTQRDAQLAEVGTSRQAGASRQSHASQKARPSRPAPSLDTSAQPNPATAQMSFEEAYGYYTQGG